MSRWSAGTPVVPAISVCPVVTIQIIWNGAHAATFTRGPFVISLEQQKPGEAVFTALSEIARGKLRLKK